MAPDYCDNPWNPARRRTRPVQVGPVTIGGDSPIVIQSMLTSDTMDTEACVRETIALVQAGCEIVRVTAPTVKDAANLAAIKRRLASLGISVPLVADIHFKPQAALEAAKWVEKVRVNPGNYADKKRFAVREYTDEEYAAELARVAAEFTPLVLYCRAHGVAMRIGTNHGSLSDRILNRYGDTPLGMAESALEFARIARRNHYHDFVFSMKASNPKVMIAAYRLLASRLRQEGEDWNFPLHLGVTEAGDGEDGRIKSAIGIGSLLLDGLGDTVRVSLTEDSVHEIPVARALVEVCSETSPETITASDPLPFNPFEYQRRPSARLTAPTAASPRGPVSLGGGEPPRVCIPEADWRELDSRAAFPRLGECAPELIHEKLAPIELDPRDLSATSRVNSLTAPALVTVADGLPLRPVQAFRLLAARIAPRHPILLKDTLHPHEARATSRSGGSEAALKALLRASAIIGSLLCDGIGDVILVRGEHDPERAAALAFNILQASGTRIFRTDYVACPSCGRTLFNLQTTTARIKAATSHLKGVRIAVMGCIVNGPGEMADADFGYVGGAPGKINLYVGKTPVKFNIPEEEAVQRLIDLIKEHGKWVEPPASHIPAEQPTHA